jgi:hypothetical protein
MLASWPRPVPGLPDAPPTGDPLRQDHQFLLLDRERDDYRREFPFDDPRSLWIHDDVIDHVADTLRWIPTFSPWRTDRRGLHIHGLTLVHRDGAAIAERVFRGWAELFALFSPRVPFGRSFLEPPANHEQFRHGPGLCTVRAHLIRENDHGRQIEVERDSLVAAFRQLADWSARVAADERLFLLHAGL